MKFNIILKFLINIILIIISIVFKNYIYLIKRNNCIENFYNNISHNIHDIFKNRIRKSIKWPLSNIIKFKPIMTPNELKAFSYFMKPGNIYFEFGAGGSTNIASFYKIKTYSVESDAKWHKKLKDNHIKAFYITIDLNANLYGFPGNNTGIKKWKEYIEAYKPEYNADIILIDGRFRVACALNIFNKIKNDTIVLIHDYTQRNYYYILEQFYLKLYSWDTLTLFIKRPNIYNIPKLLYNTYIKEPLL